MTTTSWTCSASSAVPSDSWPGYAARLSALLTAVTSGLPGEIAWRELPRSAAEGGARIDPADRAGIEDLLHRSASTLPSSRPAVAGDTRRHLGSRLNGSRAADVPTTSVYLHGARHTDGQQSGVLLHAAFGRPHLPAHATIEVEEPGEASLWWYPDEVVTSFVGGVVRALGADRAEVLDAALLRRLAEVGGPLDVGSHTYVERPVDPADLPRAVRQMPCGSGALVIAAAPDPDVAVEVLWRVADLLDPPR